MFRFQFVIKNIFFFCVCNHVILHIKIFMYDIGIEVAFNIVGDHGEQYDHKKAHKILT